MLTPRRLARVTPDDANYFGAQGAVVIEKKVSADNVNWFDADDPTGPIIAAGANVYFRVAVTNNSTGNLAATVDLSDTILVGTDTAHDFVFGGNQTTTVAAGATVYSDVITDTALAGQNEDQASATATVTDGVNTTPVTVTPDDANYFGAQGAVVIENKSLPITSTGSTPTIQPVRSLRPVPTSTSAWQ